MNSKSKQHEQFLFELGHYDLTEQIIKPNHNGKSNQTPKYMQEDQPDGNLSGISEIFSMNHMKQFNQIKQFIESEGQTLPLLIRSDPNTGKKTLLTQIVNHYQKYSNKTKIFIANFGSVNRIYSQILYNIMVKLRITFGINQKVEVNEEKIRRFFKYWLDITSDQIQKDNLGYAKSQKQTLIIIMDAIDQLTNQKDEKVFPEFWLPQKLPKNVKLILSSASSEISIQKLCSQNKVKILNLTQKILSQKLKSKLKPQITSILDQRGLSMFQLKVLTWSLDCKPGFKISAKQSFDEILQKYIIECSSNRLSQNEIKSLILCLSLSKKGLTQTQLGKIMKIRAQTLLQFLFMFKPLIHNFDSYYLITNSEIKSFIERIYDPVRQKRKKYHEVIAKVLKKEQISIRKLEEQIYHLTQTENYFEIKEVVTEIQNFLVLYTPPCKYLLCNSWKNIQLHLNSDPVFEYNKAVESFLTHYHPKQDQLFKIIYQLSMFFRQYSQFEGAKIPSFRHPLIKGQDEQLQQISVYEQLKHLKMTTSLKQVQKKNFTDQIRLTDSNGNDSNRNGSNNGKQTNQAKKSNLIPKKSHLKRQQFSIRSDGQLLNMHQTNKSSFNAQSQQQNLDQIQCINLQIKRNQQKFRNHYLQILQPYLKQFYAPSKKLYMNDKFVKSSNKNTEMQEEEDCDQNILEIGERFLKEPQNIDSIKSSMILKNLDQYFEQNYHREEITKFYYYKEWIWIQFPWICQSFNSNFSEMIQRCIGNPTEYMSMEKQLSLVKEVLKISKVSKLNKSSIYENKPIELHSINTKKLHRTKKQNSTVSIVRKALNDKTLPMRFTLDRQSLDISQNNSNSMANFNLAKYELNMSKIDDKLMSEVSKQVSNRCTFDSRVLIKSQSRAQLNQIVNKSPKNPFLTQQDGPQKQNPNKLPNIVGSLKQNRCKTQSRSINKSVSWIQVHQNKISQFDSSKGKKTHFQLNSLINQNKKLKERIQQLQKTSIMLDKIDEETLIHQNNEKYQQLQKIKDKIIKKQETHQHLKSMLETVIKICDNNQSHEKESQLLSTFMENLKTMTRLEIKNTQINAKNIQIFADKSRNTIKDLMEQKIKLSNELKVLGGYQLLRKQQNQQDEFSSGTRIPNSRPFKKGDTLIQRDKTYKVTISSKHDCSYTKAANKARAKTFKTAKRQTVSKPSKILASGIWNQLSQIFHYDPSNYEQSVENSKYLLEQFQQKVAKYRELNLQHQQIYYENDQFEEEIEQLKEELTTLNHKNQMSQRQKSDQNQSQDLIEKKKLLSALKSRTQILQECMGQYLSDACDQTNSLNA